VTSDDYFGCEIVATVTPRACSKPAIKNGSLLAHDGRILAVGPSATVKVWRDATVVDCKG